MIQAFIAAVVIAFTLGGSLCSYATWRWFRVSAMESQIKAYKEGQQKTAEALGFNQQQDDEADAIESKNQEVLNAIRQTKDDAKTAKAAADGVQCLDAVSVRNIWQLR